MIVGYAAYLESHYMDQLDDKGKDSVGGVRKGATRLSVLIKDMLELTRLGRVKNPYTKVDMCQVVESTPGQGAKFLFTIPKNLNPAKPLY